MNVMKSAVIGCTICLFIMGLVSCSSFNLFKDQPPVEEDTETTHQVQRIESLEEQVDSLEKTKVVHAEQIAQKDQTISALKEKIQALESKNQALEKKQIEVKKPLGKIKHTDPENLYKKARNLLIEEQYRQAADGFSAFINNYPDNSLADNAVYWLGECFYSEGNFQQAILVFQDLVKKYPKSEKVPDALLKTGYSYLAINDNNRAHHFLKQVIKRYPFSPASEKAQVKLGEFNE